MAQTYLNSDATRQLNQSLGDINTWYEKFQPHELEKLDSFLNDYNTDFKYRGATDRALAGISGQLGPNVVGAGALPNLRAGAAGLASGQAALVGGTAVDAQLGQQQNYAQALQKVVQAGHAHKNLADYGIQNNSQMHDTVEEAFGHARDMKRSANAALLGSVVGAGMGWLGGANGALKAASGEQLSTAMATGDPTAFTKWQSMPLSNAAWLGGKASAGWNSLSDWASTSSLGKLLNGGPPITSIPINGYLSPGQIQG